MSAREAVARRPVSLERSRGHWLRRRHDRAARWLVLRLLSRIRGGELELREDGESLRFGGIVPDRPLRAVVRVRSPRA